MNDYSSATRSPSPSASFPTQPGIGPILLVDDDREIQDILARTLRGAGYGVSCAEDGEAGWDELCAGRFDLLITDYKMPRLSGLGLLRRVRAVPLDLPVILTSANMPWHVPELMTLLTPGTAIEKPYTLTGLLATVRSIVNHQQATRRNCARPPVPSLKGNAMIGQLRAAT